MRKILVMVCALLVLITLPLMAGINKGTVAGYYSVESSEQYLSNWGGPSTAVDIESTSVGVMVKGSSFSDPANPFGYSYNLRVGKKPSSLLLTDQKRTFPIFPSDGILGSMLRFSKMYRTQPLLKRELASSSAVSQRPGMMEHTLTLGKSSQHMLQDMQNSIMQ